MLLIQTLASTSSCFVSSSLEYKWFVIIRIYLSVFIGYTAFLNKSLLIYFQGHTVQPSGKKGGWYGEMGRTKKRLHLKPHCVAVYQSWKIQHQWGKRPFFYFFICVLHRTFFKQQNITVQKITKHTPPL